MKSSEVPKPTQDAPPAGGSIGKKSDDEDTVAIPPPLKVGLLPTGLSRAIVIAALVLFSAVVAVGLFGNRYMLVSTQRSENAVVYRLDRMTGQVSFCSPAACVPVSEKIGTAN